MPEPVYAAASVRNSKAIFGVLSDELMHRRTLLEIGTGTAHHAVSFAEKMPWIVWQTSDLDEGHARIRNTVTAAGLENLLAPMSLDVRDAELPAAAYDVVYSSNTAHIMSSHAARKMLLLAGHVLVDGGLFCYYGPFKRDGKFNTQSNAEFDASLRSRDPEMGIRDFGYVNDIAAKACLGLQRTYAMPANNLFAVWARQPREG